MPPRHMADLTIPNAATESEELDLRAGANQFLTSLLIVSPALPEASQVVTVHAATKVGGTYQPLQSDGVDITLPATKATSIHPIGMIGAIKLVAGVVTTAARVFQVSGGQADPT